MTKWEIEWICTRCGRVVIAGSYECCGKVEEFSPERHSHLLIGKSNSWINVWEKWEKHPLIEEILHRLVGEGCYSADTVLNAFIERLLETLRENS
jgi:hypothetical protein